MHIDFQLSFLFTSLSKSFFIVLFATYSVNVDFRDYSYYVDRMNPLFPCDHGAATHSWIMHDTGGGTLCKNANGCREGTGEIQDCGDKWPDWQLKFFMLEKEVYI